MKSDCDMLRRLPDLVLFTKVFTYFNFTDYALTSCASQYSLAHWEMANQQKPLHCLCPLLFPILWLTFFERGGLVVVLEFRTDFPPKKKQIVLRCASSPPLSRSNKHFTGLSDRNNER